MQVISANEAKTHFGRLLDNAQREPVKVTRHNRTVGVMVSAQDYEEMRAFYADRLQHTLQRTAQEASQNGLTDDQLERLLADES